MFSINSISKSKKNEFVNSQMIFSMCYNLFKTIDKENSTFNLKISYYMYKLLKYRKKSNYYISKMVLLCLLLNVGAYSVNLDRTNEKVNSYIIAKYLSPLKKESKILLYQDLANNISKNHYKKMGTLISMFKEFEKYYVAHKFDYTEVKRCGFDSSSYPYYKYKDFTDLIKEGIIDLEIDEARMVSEISSIFSSGESQKIANGFLRLLSYSFEMYNNDTLEHSRSTAIIASYIAYKMKLKPRTVKKMYFAGLVHDMGKLMIDKKILEKPSKLTGSEYEQMKMHVTYSKEILSFYFNNEIVRICYRHHERLDGSGYPLGLKESDLTIEDKILQVSDVVSALLIRRCYKEEFSNQMIVEFLEKEKNLNHLDKEVCDTFIKYNKKITKLAKVPIFNSKNLINQMKMEKEILEKLNQGF